LPVVPIAAFLAGALLTLLMPVALLIALVVWYWVFSVRVPDTVDGSEAATPPAVSDPALTAPDPARAVTAETRPPAHGA
jgi:hypothetical protein